MERVLIVYAMVYIISNACDIYLHKGKPDVGCDYTVTFLDCENKGKMK